MCYKHLIQFLYPFFFIVKLFLSIKCCVTLDNNESSLDVSM